MIVDVPFHYLLEVKMPRSPKIVQVAVHDVHPMDIPQMDDAVLVARYVNSRHKTTPVEVWHLDGRFWRPATTGTGDSDANRPVTPQEYFQALAKSCDGGPGPGLAASKVSIRLKQYDSVEAVGARVICSSTRDEVVAQMQDAASRIVVTGERVLRPSSEPLLKATQETHHFSGKTNHWIYTDVVHLEDVGENTGRSELWRLDDFDRMVETMRRRAAVELDAPTRERPEVFRPDLLTWDHDRQALWQEIANDLSSFKRHRDGFGETSIEEFSAYARLRDHLAASDPSSDADAHRAGELIAEARRCCTGSQWYTPFVDAEQAYSAFYENRVLQAAPEAVEALSGLDIR